MADEDLRAELERLKQENAALKQPGDAMKTSAEGISHSKRLPQTASSEDCGVWISKKYFDETSLQFRTVWDLYLKFYSVFLPFNGTALFATVQLVQEAQPRAVIAAAFIAQNAIALITGLKVAQFSLEADERAQKLTETVGRFSESALPEELKQSPLPGKLAYWGGMGNAIGHAVFIILWLIIMFTSRSTATAQLWW